MMINLNLSSILNLEGLPIIVRSVNTLTRLGITLDLGIGIIHKDFLVYEILKHN